MTSQFTETDRLTSYPPIGKIFQLTLNKEKRYFMLVNTGYCHNFDELQERIMERGNIPEYRWWGVFKNTFPKSDEEGPIGLPCDRSGFFPCIYANGERAYHLVQSEFGEQWRWLIEVHIHSF
ncbi:MAG: hypothetical protein G01um101466_198 [Parcubacteria group bacterium Gr01-1014_66]|nr:MAG: hypothetical protein G01um101466_198 [Parcubacteria group bacterium Gr01-1014_66]